jgi:hypothetical protein
LDRNLQQKPSEKTSYDAFRNLVETGLPDSAKRMATAVAKAPDAEVPPAVGPDIDTLVKSKPDLKPMFEAVLKKWEASKETRVGKALERVTKSLSKK